jgi:hypothetical protein
VCKTFNKLPNDPLVMALKPVQVEWINYNLRLESEAMSGKKEGLRLESASDLPTSLFENGKAEGRPARKYLGQQG